MRFMLLVHQPEGAPAEPIPPTAAADARWRAALDALRAQGALVSAGRLKPSPSATCVHLEGGGRLSLRDGPFVDSACALEAFVVVDARDGEHAARLAERLPGAEVGFVEVRELWAFP